MAERRAGRGRAGERDGRRAWEYRLVSMGNPLEPDVEARANAFGRLAWELVTIDAGVWVFKRPAGPAVEEGNPDAAVQEAIPVAGEAALTPAVGVTLLATPAREAPAAT